MRILKKQWKDTMFSMHAFLSDMRPVERNICMIFWTEALEAGNFHLYEKCGFVRVGEEHIINDKMTLVYYEKR